MQVFENPTFKCQLPPYKMGEYTLNDNLYIHAEDEEGKVIILPKYQAMIGECLQADEVIHVLTWEDPAAGLFPLYSKRELDNGELMYLLTLLQDHNCTLKLTMLGGKRTSNWEMTIDKDCLNEIRVVDHSSGVDMWMKLAAANDLFTPCNWKIESSRPLPDTDQDPDAPNYSQDSEN